MHLLWIKVGGLWPADRGGRLRSFHLLAELSRRARVTVVTTHGPDEDPRDLAAALPGAAVVSVPFAVPRRGTGRFAVALARAWLAREPVDVGKCRVPALRAAAARALAAGDVDLCVADFLVALPNVPPARAPVVLFEHNVEHQIWRRLAAGERRRAARALLEVEWRRLRRFEARACAACRRTIAVSEADRALLAGLAPAADLRVVPTGVDVDYFAPDGVAEDPGAIVFTGAMDWYPNEEGVLHFLDAVLPRVRARVPAASLAIVGRSPSRRLRAAAARAGATVTGTVADVRPFVARAAVSVVPLRIGGGTRLKIFEALAMGKAVVSTGVGAEGLPVVPGTHLLRADEPEDFAAAVAALLCDPARRRALGSAGRELVERRFSWREVARQFEERCREVVSHAR